MGFAYGPTVYNLRFTLNGTACTLSVFVEGISSGPTFVIPLPIQATASPYPYYMWGVACHVINAGVYELGSVSNLLTSAPTDLHIWRQGFVDWTSSSQKGAAFEVTYEI